jgi:hypothetical protein
MLDKIRNGASEIQNCIGNNSTEKVFIKIFLEKHSVPWKNLFWDKVILVKYGHNSE